MFEGKKDKLEFLQTFFVKSFLISFILMIVATFACVFMHDFQLHMVQKLFNANEDTLNWIVLITLSIWKILIIQFTFIPAIVIWAIRKCQCTCKDCNCK